MEDTKPPDREGMAEVGDRFLRVMELRSGRLVRRSRRGLCGGADDRLSALPNDMLLLVLGRLRCARILSRRWRGLWTHLPDLKPSATSLPPRSKPCSPAWLLHLRCPTPSTVDITIPSTHCADGARLACLLDAVVRFSPRELCFSYQFDRLSVEAADLHLPCFPHATSMDIDWDSNICFTQLRSGEFSALESLSLGGASVIGIDTVVTRCPCLRVLSVSNSTSDIEVHSVSLQTLDVFSDSENVCISSIDIVTPNLKQLKLIFGADTDLSVSISAPMVEKVVWNRWFLEMTLLFGFWSLDFMDLRPAVRFGDGDYWLPSEHVLYLVISALHQSYPAELQVDFAQEMEKLPVIDFSVLKLFLETSGHVFGALLWRLLGLHQICAATKRLELAVWGSERRTCPENCPCDVPKNWRGQIIPLTHLEEVHIKYFTGEEHEHDFLKLIFRSSPMLNRVTVKLVHDFGGCTNKIYNTFLAYPDVKGYVYFSSGELVPPPSD